MASGDEFIHISTGPSPARSGSPTNAFYDNAEGKRWFTEGVIVESLRAKYPKYLLTINPAYSTSLLGFANSRDDASYSLRDGGDLVERQFLPPARRYNDENGGAFGESVVMGCYDYIFQGNVFLVYIVTGADGMFGKTTYNYILVAPEADGIDMIATEKVQAQSKTDQLVREATKWGNDLHKEVLVFDQGYWQKNRELWENVQTANWEDVILEKEKKEAIIDDVLGFFDGQERYSEFGVPWKRGVIFYGPPGNGKTISTKALMHDVSKRLSPTIESLYVKSFSSYGGPELGIRMIFLKARQMAPCLLIFEDIDSLVSPMIRSYFLNEVDGLESNHGILMIGSTNHLDRLDPGIAKRPSRFDRKYFFDVPTKDERIQYADYWRHKLRNNKKVDFPPEMSVRVADITAGFSFAYMKEAFVAALLVIVARTSTSYKNKHREDNLSGNILWKELKKQIESLRNEMDGEDGDDANLSMASQFLPAMSGIMERSSAALPIDITGAHQAFLGANYAGQRPDGCYIPRYTPNQGGMPRYM
ncbi:P-loop containing nucleoside triphosphate hydrolase [Glarea lozoyensis ATCC 20868]|uniref:p-loop containing nucleoside triphosphate hydrolase n=1 Tax=Glarea lozoyensis (strain ATCC 20868 / MF5171) TaxID=1116229 RepID=S3DXL8_GLAL2|nr:P-loop containing nucleoside triphosphate hydrolase [Glarea lozoyensis ATCC 20868]EPE36676.1 P-loop containing nucleoside triphosphate hydrolase [Glarea lozoyensis ATCC 20868]